MGTAFLSNRETINGYRQADAKVGRHDQGNSQGNFGDALVSPAGNSDIPVERSGATSLGSRNSGSLEASR